MAICHAAALCEVRSRPSDMRYAGVAPCDNRTVTVGGGGQSTGQ